RRAWASWSVTVDIIRPSVSSGVGVSIGALDSLRRPAPQRFISSRKAPPRAGPQAFALDQPSGPETPGDGPSLVNAIPAFVPAGSDLLPRDESVGGATSRSIPSFRSGL